MGFGKFVDGSAILPSEEVARADYNEKETKAFALLCEHLTDAQLAHIQYCDNVKSAWEALCGVHEAKTIGNKLFLRRRFFTIKMQEGDDMLVHINTVKALADQLRSIEVNIQVHALCVFRILRRHQSVSPDVCENQENHQK